MKSAVQYGPKPVEMIFVVNFGIRKMKMSDIMKTVKEFVLSCIERTRGDDLYRAQCAFKNCTPDQMNEEYGQSGQTRQQILDGYKAHNQKCDVAIAAVNGIGRDLQDGSDATREYFAAE